MPGAFCDLREPAVIFATVGTHGDGFPRMLQALETLGDEDELVVQYGHGTPPANATRAEAFLPFGTMAELFEAADVVITHAGVGSILLASRAGHVPVIVPRLARLGEHVDDHQVELARALEQRDGVLVCWEGVELAELVARVPPRQQRAAPAAVALAQAVGEELRRDGAPPRRHLTSRLRESRLQRLASDTLGAYLEIGTDFQPQPPGRRVDPNGLAGYHCDFSHKASPSLQQPGSWLAGALAGEPWRSPMMVSQAALGFWERHLAGEDTLDRFLALAGWLLRYGERDARGLGWAHDYAVPKYGLTPGWRSGMTQGEAISVLLRAHAASGEERYRDAAAAAFGPFASETPAGGVVRTLDGSLVIEEYPAAEPTAVLNGWIFGLLGLHELARVDDRPEVADTFARSRAGLLALLPRYDVGWWSCYSLGDYGRPDLAKPFYQRLHVVLLDALDAVAPDPLLRDTARRWEAQLTRSAMARIAVDKVAFRARRAIRR
jgi:UDP-N-acetylglucosamine transferase subunit ALG13